MAAIGRKRTGRFQAETRGNDGSKPLYLLFVAITVATFLRGMHTYMGMDRLPVSDPWFGWFTVNSMGWMILIFGQLSL